MLTQSITILILVSIVGCILYGRRLIKTEKVDAVFGNPERAKGGTHWIIVGSSAILLVWLYYSWDIAKGFYPKSANELCQGGMQQRVALARCLINDPDLILMDEPLGALDALTREKMQSLVLKIWKETGKTIILITHSVEEALLLGERLYVMAPRPGRIHKEYKLPFAEMGLKDDLREIKKNKEFSSKREEILSMIWNMEEEIMGKDN